MEKDKTTETADKHKLRSKLYPRYDLEKAVLFIENVSKLGGSSVSAEAVAADMNKSTTNSTFIGRVSSARQFGLVDLGKGRLSLTALAQRILYPVSTLDQQAAKKEAFSNPPLYKDLISSFRGKKIPEMSSLGNILKLDYGIQTAAREIAASNFVSSAEFGGLLKNGLLVMADDFSTNSGDTPEPTGNEELATNTPGAEKHLGGPSDGFAPKTLTEHSNAFIFDFDGGIRLIVPKTTITSDAIADGALKDIRKELRDFSGKYLMESNETL